jgi:hypothetical protein
MDEIIEDKYVNGWDGPFEIYFKPAHRVGIAWALWGSK